MEQKRQISYMQDGYLVFQDQLISPGTKIGVLYLKKGRGLCLRPECLYLLELGPTEFVVGLHCMEPDVAMNEVGSAVSAVLGMGDILLYDYRICHRVR